MDRLVKSASKGAEQVIQWGRAHDFKTCFDRAEGVIMDMAARRELEKAAAPHAGVGGINDPEA